MISVSEAKAILQKQQIHRQVITIPISESCGYFLAEAVNSRLDVPSFDNSAMDGYAFCWNDEFLNNQKDTISLQIVGEVAAGSFREQVLEKGQAVRIFTGAPIPPGADTVIMQEKVERQGDQIVIHKDYLVKGSHVRYRGSQCKEGSIVAKKGGKITPGTVSLLASVGIKEVSVWGLPTVSILLTGNEIKNVGEALEAGQIYNANGPALEAWLSSLGIGKITTRKVSDDKEKVIESIAQALEESDVVLVTGGISVGEYDFVQEAMQENGVETLFYKIKQRPGKPLFVGRKGDKMVFALPGNPASVLSCFMQYVKPFLLSLKGDSSAWEQFEWLPLMEGFEKKIPLTQFLKAEKLGSQIRVLQGQESFNLISFGTASGFVEIPEDVEKLDAGSLVKFYPW
ncbi:molybdopterin molybdotransferase MoeA [Algoriphagus kandeliae]|uniref:Molybdopterin molybdenumtransferase n=1 Tax=Algoriphagus kandeliae TaxID=2562278 RepID=A0A4Y9QNF3_9BACT|nr:gephyrin-like molybdotransferase Glp [Algoriphagus kandeliae]TFV94181.1 molybdopterin molybdotransferase MoeA [Algoriphagus kandeliae]